jgi:hypothetical protein
VKILAPVAALAAMALSLGLTAPQPISAMQWHRRIVLAVSPDANDPNVEAQRHILQTWRNQAADRDVTLVEVEGARVLGVSDSAASLRQRYRLKADGFEALLIGKDGRIALRAGQPLTAEILQSAIEAMPMRRAGQR